MLFNSTLIQEAAMLRSDFCVHPLKFAVSAATVLIGIILGATFVFLHKPLEAVILFLIAALFTWQAVLFGAWVSITGEGIRRHIFGWTLKRQNWAEIKEVGVVGTKVFNRLNPNKTGFLYIYFSPKELAEEERFRLALNFPPKDMIFLLYNKEREDVVQALWNTKLKGYNTGSLKLGR